MVESKCPRIKRFISSVGHEYCRRYNACQNSARKIADGGRFETQGFWWE